MKIYIDSQYRCHTSNPDGIYTEIEAPEQFIGKCDTYIEGFRVRLEGYTYTRDDGTVFGPHGSSVSPWKPYDQLAAAQAQYEADHTQMQDMENALAILLGGGGTT